MNYIEVLDSIDAAVWGPPMIILLLGCHIYTTIRTKGIQRKLPLALKLSITKDNGAQGDVSNFGAMATSLASTLGTGSIVGVATAVLSGGPGAVLWMWLTGILGMATKYTEVYAAMKYRVKDRQGHMMGGAMHVWEQRYKRPDGTVPWWAKFMAIWFAVMACLTIFGVGSAVQTSAITSVAQANFGVEPWIVAAIVCGSALLIIMGGLGTISSICEKLVPIMGVAYILGCAYILVCNWAFIGESFRLIFECAFTPRAAFGGAVGSGIIVALQFGCARGLFSNEAGSGSAPCAAAAAECDDPVKMGFVQALGVLIDTVVICSCTAFLMLLVPQEITEGLAGMDLLQTALQYHLGGFGVVFIAATLALFSFSTFLGVLYYARGNVAYLCGDNWWSQTVYKLIALAMLVIGGMQAYTVVWDLGDVGIGLMTIFNMIALVPMAKEALAALNDYEKRKKLQ